MFDYKYAFCEVYEGYREAYEYFFGKEPDDKTLDKLAYENANDASRGYNMDIEAIYEDVELFYERTVLDGNVS